MGNPTLADSQTTTPAALVPVGAGDADFLLAVYASTREEELAHTGWSAEQKSAFVRMQFDAQRRHYLAHYPSAVWQLIVQDGRPIGRIIVDRGGNEILLMDIALLAPYRGGGIGSGLIRALIDEAAAAGKAVRLHVESFNPARRLYSRFGFVEVEEYGIYICMVLNPPGKALIAAEALEINRTRDTVNQGESHVA